jgi:hypothetical protein
MVNHITLFAGPDHVGDDPPEPKVQVGRGPVIFKLANTALFGAVFIFIHHCAFIKGFVLL